ncbi:MAG: AAA family ATPase, partial [Wolbachia pipientis]
RTGNEDAKSLTQLLTKLDKEFLSSKNITVVAATNYKEHLDPALIRGGRLDVHINIPALDVTIRRKVLGERLKELSPKDIETIVNNTDGFSPANLIALIDHIKESK